MSKSPDLLRIIKVFDRKLQEYYLTHLSVGTVLRNKHYNHQQIKYNIFIDDEENQFERVGQFFQKLEIPPHQRSQQQMIDEESSLESMLLDAKNEGFITKDNIREYFQRDQFNLRRVFEESKNAVHAEFAEDPNFWRMPMTSLPIRSQNNPEQIFHVELNSQDLQDLKDGNVVPLGIVKNSLNILKSSKEFLPNVQIVSFDFMQQLLDGLIFQQVKEDQIPYMAQDQFKKAAQSLSGPLLNDGITIVPFFWNNHYDLLIIKKTQIVKKGDKEYYQIVYCSSRYVMKKVKIVLNILKEYLKLEHKKEHPKIELNNRSFQIIQLMLPKQSRAQDSGLHFILNCEYLCTKNEELQRLEHVEKRDKLHLYPRTLVFIMRQRIWNLYASLSSENVNFSEAINNYFKYGQDHRRQLHLQDPHLVNKRWAWDEVEVMQARKFEILTLGKAGRNKHEKFDTQLKYYYSKYFSFYTNE